MGGGGGSHLHVGGLCVREHAEPCRLGSALSVRLGAAGQDGGLRHAHAVYGMVGLRDYSHPVW